MGSHGRSNAPEVTSPTSIRTVPGPAASAEPGAAATGADIGPADSPSATAATA